MLLAPGAPSSLANTEAIVQTRGPFVQMHDTQQEAGCILATILRRRMNYMLHSQAQERSAGQRKRLYAEAECVLMDTAML